MVDDEAVVQAAAEAAESVIFSQYKQSAVRDVDVTVRFEDGTLSVDVYLNVPGASEHEQEAVADEAARAATATVDDVIDATAESR